MFRQFAWKNQNCWSICLEKSKLLVNLPGKIEIVGQFAWKNRNCWSICLEKSKFFPGEIDIFGIFAWKNRNLFYPDPRPLRFQARLTPQIMISAASRLYQIVLAAIIV